jgi:hypothetical protein
VAYLDVPVHDAVLMHESQRVRDLEEKVPDGRLVQGLAGLGRLLDQPLQVACMGASGRQGEASCPLSLSEKEAVAAK